MDYNGAGIQTRGARAAAAAMTRASMSSLAPAFDEGSSNGADVLLQTREWFPPARALAALPAFLQTRLAFAAASHKQQSSTIGPHPAPDDLDSALGNDPLAASSGQVVVDVERKYCVVYCLVNTIYVLGITTVVHTAINAEIRVRSADTWSGGAEALSLKHRGNLDTFAKAFFELPPETLAAGDEVAATIAPVAASLPTDEQQKDQPL